MITLHGNIRVMGGLAYFDRAVSYESNLFIKSTTELKKLLVNFLWPLFVVPGCVITIVLKAFKLTLLLLKYPLS